MKAQRPYPQITITPKGEAALVGGHPWVYEGEVTGLSGPVSDGQLVDVISRRGSWLGCGFFNSRSRIRVRVLSRNPNDRFDRAFWRRRIQYAWDYRKTVMGPEDSRCCRVIFGEADGFPGLTVDRFESVLVAQVLCLGMELIKEELFSLLLEVLRSDGQDVVGVYERNDVAFDRNRFRVRGDTVEIYPVYANGYAIRVEFFGDEIDRISEINPVTGQAQRVLQHVAIYPASHYVTTKEKMERAVQEIDPDAFVIVCDAHEILGEGFGVYAPGGL